MANILSNLWGTFRQIKDHSDAADKAKKAYAEKRTLLEILTVSTEATDEPLDDRAAEALLDAIAHVENTLFNLSALLGGLAADAELIRKQIESLREKPLKSILEPDDM